MNNAEKEDLYDRIDEDDEMSDSEKRETYFAEVEEQEDRDRWENEH